MGWVEKNTQSFSNPGKTLASIDPGPAIGKAGASVDNFVNQVIPGGWKTVGSVALAALTYGASLSADAVEVGTTVMDDGTTLTEMSDGSTITTAADGSTTLTSASGVTTDLGGFTNLNDYQTAIDAGFTNASDYAQGTLEGFTNGGEFANAQSLGFNNYSDYMNFVTGGQYGQNAALANGSVFQDAAGNWTNALSQSTDAQIAATGAQPGSIMYTAEQAGFPGTVQGVDDYYTALSEGIHNGADYYNSLSTLTNGSTGITTGAVDSALAPDTINALKAIQASGTGALKGAATNALMNVASGKPVTICGLLKSALTGAVGGAAGNITGQFGGCSIASGIAGGSAGSATGAAVSGKCIGQGALTGAITGGVAGATGALTSGLNPDVSAALQGASKVLAQAGITGNSTGLLNNMLEGALLSTGLTSLYNSGSTTDADNAKIAAAINNEIDLGVIPNSNSVTGYYNLQGNTVDQQGNIETPTALGTTAYDEGFKTYQDYQKAFDNGFFSGSDFYDAQAKGITTYDAYQASLNPTVPDLGATAGTTSPTCITKQINDITSGLGGNTVVAHDGSVSVDFNKSPEITTPTQPSTSNPEIPAVYDSKTSPTGYQDADGNPINEDGTPYVPAPVSNPDNTIVPDLPLPENPSSGTSGGTSNGSASTPAEQPPVNNPSSNTGSSGGTGALPVVNPSNGSETGALPVVNPSNGSETGQNGTGNEAGSGNEPIGNGQQGNGSGSNGSGTVPVEPPPVEPPPVEEPPTDTSGGTIVVAPSSGGTKTGTTGTTVTPAKTTCCRAAPASSTCTSTKGALPVPLTSQSLAGAPVYNSKAEILKKLQQLDPRILQALGISTGAAPVADPIMENQASANTNPNSPLYQTSLAAMDEKNPSANLPVAREGGSRDDILERHEESEHVPEFITGATGHYVKGKGDGQSDDIPAMLADGEYVFDADTVAQLGNGSSDAGAKLLDHFREALREHKRSAPNHSIPPKSSPLQYMKEALKRHSKG